MWGNKKEKINKERGELGPRLEGQLAALAYQKGIILEFTDHEVPSDFLRMVQWTGDFGFIVEPCYVKVRMITGRMKEDWKLVTGGYLMEHYIRGIKGPYTVILGGALDYDAKSEKGEAGKHPLFISALDKNTFSVSKERRPDRFGPSGSAEQIVWVHLVGDKMEEILKIIEKGLKGETEPRVVVVAPRPNHEPENIYRPKHYHGWDPLRDDPLDGVQPRHLVRPVPRPTAPPARIIRVNPADALENRISDVRALSEELGEALKGREIHIEGLPEDLPEEVVKRLKSGVKVLGMRMDEFRYGQRYEDPAEKKRTTWICAGLREEGQLVVQVEEDLKKNGQLNLVIGVLRLIGEGKEGLTASAFLNGSVLELSAYSCLDPEVSIRRDYTPLGHKLLDQKVGRLSHRAERLFKRVFSKEKYTFGEAMERLLGFTA